MRFRVDSDTSVPAVFRYCHTAWNKIAPARLGDKSFRDRVAPVVDDRDFDWNRAVDSDTCSDWDRRFDYSDKHCPAADIDPEDRRNIRGSWLVDRDIQDSRHKVVSAVPGSDMDYFHRENFHHMTAVEIDRDHRLVENSQGKRDSLVEFRIVEPGLDKGHTLVESSPANRDTPEKMDILVLFGNPDWSIRVVDTLRFVRRDWLRKD